MLVDSPEYDDKVLSYVLSTIHPPYIQIAYFILSDRCNFGGKYCFVLNDMPPPTTSARRRDVNLSLSVTLTERGVTDFDATLKTLLDIQPNGIGFNMIVTGKHFAVPDGCNEKVSACMVRAFEEFRQRGIPEDRIMCKATAFPESRVYPFDQKIMSLSIASKQY